jgi:hypothetical protein
MVQEGEKLSRQDKRWWKDEDRGKRRAVLPGRKNGGAKIEQEEGGGEGEGGRRSGRRGEQPYRAEIAEDRR